jgi:outer membrane protein TolC
MRLNEELTASMEKSERAGHAPRIGIEGFVGTNQYTMQFNPTGSAGWYGSSYVGLSFKLPLISGSGSGSKIDQLRLQKKSINFRLQDKKAEISSENLRLMQDIDMLESQVSLSEHNTDLLKNNLELFKDRYNKGLINSYDMLNSETDLQKSITELDKLKTELFLKKLKLVRNSGMLGSFIQKLK